MSQSNTASDSPALGSRDNWWGTDSENDAAPDRPSGHAELAGVSRIRWVAGSILRQAAGATLLCPRCFHELDRAAELSDPEHHVPRSEIELEDGFVLEAYADHRRHRRCTECGYISWGGILQDRADEAFLSIVDDVLDFAELPSSTREAIQANAQSRKATGVSDQANMEQVVTEIEYPGELRDS